MAEEGRPEYQRLRPPLQKRERTRFEDLAAAARNVGRLGVRWGSPATTCRGPTMSVMRSDSPIASFGLVEIRVRREGLEVWG
jgi:hypothetical protein